MPIDPLDRLANLSGQPVSEVRQAWDAARTNMAKLEACPGPHQFEPVGSAPCQLERCTRCQGTVAHLAAIWYRRGLAAAPPAVQLDQIVSSFHLDGGWRINRRTGGWLLCNGMAYRSPDGRIEFLPTWSSGALAEYLGISHADYFGPSAHVSSHRELWLAAYEKWTSQHLFATYEDALAVWRQHPACEPVYSAEPAGDQ